MSDRFRPLAPGEARRSLAQRLAGRVDRIRQRTLSRFGLRPYRVFLVWTQWSGAERGEGRTQLPLHRTEILPTPLLSDLTSLMARGVSIGMLPEGSIRVSRISAAAYTSDMLRGLVLPNDFPGTQPVPGFSRPGTAGDVEFGGRVSFFWEIQEDGRGDSPASAQRFRLFSQPFRSAGGMEWSVVLQRSDRDEGRNDLPQDGTDPFTLPARR